MKFQVNIEIDEHEGKLSQREVIDLVVDSLADSLGRTGAYFDCGVNVEQVVPGLTN